MEGASFPQEERLASEECHSAIKAYLQDGRYDKDVKKVADEALALLRNVSGVDRSQLLVFDIDETVLSNMAEFEHQKFGRKPYDARWQHEWQLNGTAPALKPMLELYTAAYGLGFSVTFITGRHESARNATESNLAREGFGVRCGDGRQEDSIPCYMKLDLREDGDARPASVYKPERRGALTSQGYTVFASFGDQFSDLTGPNSAKANFKLPNPMYYLL